ncbi:MAG: hypothetical protein CSA95_01055 [Bacteroidetes bacterium]|nr:MAG: hypothetical protein CSA95_01055 [Bacteroidota bacterium]
MVFLPLMTKGQKGGYWEAGFNFGFLFAGRHTANFYNGTGENNINRILGNFYFREHIVEELDHTYDTTDIELPENMHYKPTMSAGFQGSYYFNNGLAIFLQGTYTRLKTVDVFLLHYNDILFPTNTVERYAICPIVGVEERTLIDIGVHKGYPLNEVVEFFFETGFNFTNTLVKEHKIEIGKLRYSIKNTYKKNPYVPNTNYQTYDIRQGGIGWGTMFSLGFALHFSPKICVHVAGTGYYNTTKLPGYEEFTLHLNPTARLILKNL